MSSLDPDYEAFLRECTTHYDDYDDLPDEDIDASNNQLLLLLRLSPQPSAAVHEPKAPQRSKRNQPCEEDPADWQPDAPTSRRSLAIRDSPQPLARRSEPRMLQVRKRKLPKTPKTGRMIFSSCTMQAVTNIKRRRAPFTVERKKESMKFENGVSASDVSSLENL